MTKKVRTYSICLDNDLRMKAQKIADSEGRSLSNWVRQQLIEVIKKAA